MELYKKLKEASKYVNYAYKDDMIQDLWIKLRDKGDLPVCYLVTCCKNYVIDDWKASRREEYIELSDDNEFDTLYKNSKYKDLIDKFLDCKTWYKFGKEIKMSDKTAKKFLVKIMRDEQVW